LIEAVIFDLDGTLAYLPIDYDELFRKFSKAMKKDDIHPVTETISKLDEKARKRIFKVWDKAELEALKNMTINNRGMALYRSYSTKPRALVTMQGKKVVQKILKALDLSFDFIVTRDDSLDRSDQLSMVGRNMNVKLQDVLFIGNTKHDSFAAQKVNCQFLMVR
jgi:HAD superfamily hydrolase (TIGR01549 family)